MAELPPPWTPQYWYLDRYPTFVEAEWPYPPPSDQWFTTSYGSQPSIIGEIDVWTPMVETGSLWLQRNESGSRYHVSYQPNPHTCMVQWWNDEYSEEWPYGIMPGLSEGYARSIFQVRRASGSGRHSLGMICLDSTDDLSEEGSCYALMLEGAQSGTAWDTLSLRYYPGPNGLRDTPTILASMPFTAPYSSLIPLELRWIYTAATGRLALYAQLGTALDYSDLALVLTYFAQPAVIPEMVISQGLGLVFNWLATPDRKGDGQIEIRVDQTHIAGAYFIPASTGV